MNRDDRTVLVLLAGIAVLGPLAIGLALHWPIWAWALLAVALLVMVWLVSRQLAFRRNQRDLRDSLREPAPAPRPAPAATMPSSLTPTLSAPLPSAGHAPLTVQSTHPNLLPEPPPRAPEQVHQSTTITDISLASAVPDYRFTFSATVHWRPVPGFVGLPHGNPTALAANAIIGRAYEVTSAEQPADHELVKLKLNAVLGTMLADRTGQVEAWALRVHLSLPDADVARLRKLSEVRKDEEVWERERNHERSKRAYLNDEVLKTPGSAVVWWLARDFSQVRETVALIGTLAQLSAAANDAEVPELFRPLVEAARNDPDLKDVFAPPPSQNPELPDKSQPSLDPGFDPLMLQAPKQRNGSPDTSSWQPTDHTRQVD